MTPLVPLICALAQGTPLCEGSRAAISPDGNRIAYETVSNGTVGVSVLELKSGRSVCIGNGGFLSCYPSWKDNETLVFSSYEQKMTAFEAVSKGCVDGFNLFAWRDRALTRLTRGRWFDTGSAWMPRLEDFFYVSSEGECGARNHLVFVPNGRWQDRRIAVSLGGRNCGFASPDVSEDGRLLVWSQFNDPFDVWHLCLSRSDSPQDYSLILPSNDVAVSPSFHPDSRHVFYTGYREGDPGWGVWVVDCVSGESKRLMDGERPRVTPDGSQLVYEKGGRLWLTDLKDVALPTGPLLEPEDDISDEQERVLLERTDPLGRLLIPECDLGNQRTVFFQVEIEFDGDCFGLEPVVRLVCDGHPLAFQLYLDKGIPWMATRNRSGERFVGLNTGRRIDAGAHQLTAIRGGDGRLFLVLDDLPIQTSRIMRREDLFQLDRPRSLNVGASHIRVRRIKYGTGWPAGIERLHVRKGWAL